MVLLKVRKGIFDNANWVFLAEVLIIWGIWIPGAIFLIRIRLLVFFLGILLITGMRLSSGLIMGPLAQTTLIVMKQTKKREIWILDPEFMNCIPLPNLIL